MFVAAAVLVQAVAHLAVNPNFERAVLLYFLPPLIALFLISINLIRGTNWTVIVLCQIFLNMIAFAVVLGELPFVLPNLKPQFPGMPPQQDRVLVFYFAAYALFLAASLPAWKCIAATLSKAASQHFAHHVLPGRSYVDGNHDHLCCVVATVGRKAVLNRWAVGPPLRRRQG